MSSDLRLRIESVVCNGCEDLCWHTEVWLHDLAGSGEKVCVLYREHLTSQSAAMMQLGSWLMSHGRLIEEAEARAYLLEHQQRLW